MGKMKPCLDTFCKKRAFDFRFLKKKLSVVSLLNRSHDHNNRPCSFECLSLVRLLKPCDWYSHYYYISGLDSPDVKAWMQIYRYFRKIQFAIQWFQLNQRMKRAWVEFLKIAKKSVMTTSSNQDSSQSLQLVWLTFFLTSQLINSTMSINSVGIFGQLADSTCRCESSAL